MGPLEYGMADPMSELPVASLKQVDAAYDRGYDDGYRDGFQEKLHRDKIAEIIDGYVRLARYTYNWEFRAYDLADRIIRKLTTEPKDD